MCKEETIRLGGFGREWKTFLRFKRRRRGMPRPDSCWRADVDLHLGWKSGEYERRQSADATFVARASSLLTGAGARESARGGEDTRAPAVRLDWFFCHSPQVRHAVKSVGAVGGARAVARARPLGRVRASCPCVCSRGVWRGIASRPPRRRGTHVRTAVKRVL